jgi:DNA topoisomerase II
MSDSTEKYVKLNPREHVLLKSSMYLGDTSIRNEEQYVFSDNNIIKKQINWSPALYKIFDEIIVNAYDQTIRDNTVSYIKVNITNRYICVKNDGIGLDIYIHKKHKVYIPELIFGNLMTSTNFAEDKERITGGTHGLGAKLTNIFSKRFDILVRDKIRKLEYRQTFRDNLTKIEKPIIKKYDGKSGGVQIKFYPDFKRFGMKELDQDHIDLFTKRVHDLSGLTKRKIYINDTKIPVNGWKEYLDLYDKNLILYSCNKHWKLGFKLESNAYQISFVNGIFTNKNGKHMDHIVQQIYDKFSKSLKDISKRWIRNNFTIILKTSIVNPSFNSQTKEELMTPTSKFGITCDLDSKFFKLIDISKLKELLKNLQSNVFAKTDGSKKSKIKGIPKLEDANYAGTKKSKDCILILTEGDSAKATAISGISAIKGGRNHYGVFPLKGKLLNVRDESMNKINKNKEINRLKKIMGFKSNVIYTKDNISSLRYGSIMLMMDADEDGSHIKGLVINFLNYFYPSLLRIDGFLKVLVTPVVKATTKNNVVQFNNLSAYNLWKKKHDTNKYKIKYYKGLGTSTSKEAGEYFTNIMNHTQYIKSTLDTNPHPELELAFKKNRADNRKTWLRLYDIDKRIEYEPGMKISIKRFIHEELKHFSNYDNIRSLPSLVDGLKPSQRKVIYATFKKNLSDEVKVAQLGGYVAENTAYHHGENSLVMTIINLAQDFIGSNNANLLQPIGQFGSRLLGGKDHSSARYIFTKLSKIVKYIIRKEDNGILDYMYDDGFKIEPTVYYPIVPLILINGAEGIGTGFSTFIPNYDIFDIIEVLTDKLNNNKSKKLIPSYNNFKGSITRLDHDTYLSRGIYEITDNKLHISELPVKVWTTPYKAYLEDMIYSGSELFSSINNQSSEKEILFILKIKDIDKINSLLKTKDKNGINGLEKLLGLTKTIKISNMHAFGTDFTIKKYSSIRKIIDEFYTIRLEKYKERKKFLLKQLKEELSINESKMNWLSMILNNKIDLRKLKQQDIINTLTKKKLVMKNDSYDYLLNMSIKEMSKDNLERLKEKIKTIKIKIKDLEKKSPTDLYRNDLNELTAELKTK